MFDFVKRMFGEGKIRVEIEFDDGSTAVGLIPYIGDINTLGKAKLEETVKRMCLVEYGKRVTKVKFIGAY